MKLLKTIGAALADHAGEWFFVVTFGGYMIWQLAQGHLNGLWLLIPIALLAPVIPLPRGQHSRSVVGERTIPMSVVGLIENRRHHPPAKTPHVPRHARPVTAKEPSGDPDLQRPVLGDHPDHGTA